jgi:hypothetical protein
VDGAGDELEIQSVTEVLGSDPPEQVIVYHPPGAVTPGGGPTWSLRASEVVVQVRPLEPEPPPDCLPAVPPEPAGADPVDPDAPPVFPLVETPTAMVPPGFDTAVAPANAKLANDRLVPAAKSWSATIRIKIRGIDSTPRSETRASIHHLLHASWT